MSETYGDVTAEYLAARSGCAVVEGRLRRIRVAGEDTVEFLDSLLTQDLAKIETGGVARSLLLTPKGKMRAVMWVLRGDEKIYLLVEAARAAVVVQDLTRYLIRVNATVELEDLPIQELWGAETSLVLSKAGLGAPVGWKEEGGLMVADITLGELSRFALAGAGVELLVGAGARRLGRLALEAVRIEAGEPVMGTDIDERTIPQEAWFVPGAVSTTKGCYLGQELVARINSRGHVNRYLRGVVVAENVLPPVGSDVMFEGKAVGVVTSVAESLTLRSPIGLAMLRREVEPGTGVRIVWDEGEVSAHVAALPLDDFTESSQQPHSH